MAASQSHRGVGHFGLSALLSLVSGFPAYQSQNMASLALAMAFIFPTDRETETRISYIFLSFFRMLSFTYYCLGLNYMATLNGKG